jgi:NADPH:quinone reductase-like Zn-dependent oxidoreductase
MNSAIAHARLEPVVDSTFAFADARKAFERLASGAHFGKVAITL